MIEQIAIGVFAENLWLRCFSPTVIFSQNPPTEIAQSKSAVIVGATGLSTLDFAFSKTQRPAGGAFLGGGRTADREIVLTIRPNNIYDAKTTLNQIMGTQHRRQTTVQVYYNGKMFDSLGYISKIEGALFDKDLDIKITITLGDPLFYSDDIEMDCKDTWDHSACNAVITSKPNSEILYRSPIGIDITFNTPKQQLRHLSELTIQSNRESKPFIAYTFREEDAQKWADKAPSAGDPVKFSLNAQFKKVTWTPMNLNYVGDINLIQRADRSLRFPYIYLPGDAINVRCAFRDQVPHNISFRATYALTRSGF